MTNTIEGPEWDTAWRPIEEGCVRTASFGAWTVEQVDTLSEDGGTLGPLWIGPNTDADEGFTDVAAARKFAADLLNACDFVDGVTGGAR